MAKKQKKRRNPKPPVGPRSSARSSSSARSFAPPTTPPAKETRKSSPSLALIAMLLAVAGIGVLVFQLLKPISSEELLRQVKADYDAQNFNQVTVDVASLLERGPVAPDTLLMGADAAKRMMHFPSALKFLAEIDDDQGEDSLRARTIAGEILFDIGDARGSESEFRRALNLAPDNARVNHRLSVLLNILGRRHESAPYAFEALKAEMLDIHQLALLADRGPSLEAPDRLHAFLNHSPNDPGALLSEARTQVDNERTTEATPTLQSIMDADPTNTEAATFLGTAYWATNDDIAYAKWYAGANAQVREHPDFWNTAGNWTLMRNQPEAAARCFWEALRRDPDIRTANDKLARLLGNSTLSNIHNRQVADELAERAAVLMQLRFTLGVVMRETGESTPEEDQKNFRTIISSLKSLGRNWEAYGWARILAQQYPEFEWGTQQRDALKAMLPPGLPRYADRNLPALKIDLSGMPEPSFDPESLESPDTQSANSLRFVDATERAGIRFKNHNATTGANKLLEMYQVFGGAVAVLDANADGLPDIYFPQGCDWPVDPKQTQYIDRLYLNQADGTFADATTEAMLLQNGFAQAATAADYDGDGFTDLRVANIHGNQLLRNNGDGTFSDATPSGMSRPGEWTMGCAMVDINNDHLPDLVDINYLTGPDLFTKRCYTDDAPVSCPPRAFPASRDRVWINNGNGQFNDVSESLGLPPSKGLGVIACDLNHDDRLDLYVSCDTDPNLLFINESKSGRPKFTESGTMLGVDVDGVGNSLGSMGITVFDLNQDQTLDFFVTNYFREANTLYLSDEFAFADHSRRKNLTIPGFELVGFGTQAFDAELDGDPDLMIVNGHVQDLPHPESPPVMMPTLFLENTGGGSFTERKDGSAGECLDVPRLGRGMARLDWNRDGLEEVVFSSLDDSVVLLENESKPIGNFISIRLIGTAGCRDAIGSSVIVTKGDRTQHRQLTAGDGYCASNQRELVFAVRGEQVDTIKIHWLHGEDQTFKDVAAGRHYIAVEGRDELVPTR